MVDVGVVGGGGGCVWLCEVGFIEYECGVGWYRV